MAHAQERRTQLRGLYVYKRLPMEAACASMHLPASTGKRWKQEAKAAGDDWETARAAVALGDENFTQIAKKLLEDYLVMHQAVVDQIKAEKKLDLVDKANIMSSLTDGFVKTMAAMKRISPEISRHTTALEVITLLTTFSQKKYPQHVPALIEMLEPFGAELAKAYG